MCLCLMCVVCVFSVCLVCVYDSVGDHVTANGVTVSV